MLIKLYAVLRFPGDRNTDGGGQVQRNAAFSLLLPGKYCIWMCWIAPLWGSFV